MKQVDESKMNIALAYDMGYYSLPAAKLFFDTYQEYPSMLHNSEYYDYVKFMEHIEKKSKNKVKGEYQIDVYGKARIKEGSILIEEGILLHIDNQTSIPTTLESPTANKHYHDDDASVIPDKDQFELRLEFYFSQKHSADDICKIVEGYKKFKVTPRKKGYLNIITQTQSGLALKPFHIKPVKVDLTMNYGPDFIKLHQYMIDRLTGVESKSKGLILLYGDPGCGKTMYIRHLINSITDKKIIYATPDMASQLADPAFLTFMLDHPNSILVIEDAENILRSRKNNHNQSVANLLNSADGLLNDGLNIQIVCTFNCDIGEIDSALLRKGRLIGKHKFGPLDTESAQKLSKSLGFEKEIDKPMTLADIYNQNDLEFNSDAKGKIGFVQK